MRTGGQTPEEDVLTDLAFNHYNSIDDQIVIMTLLNAEVIY